MTAYSASKNTLYCSFCGRSQHQVRNLIAGATVFICNECVDLCSGILHGDDGGGKPVHSPYDDGPDMGPDRAKRRSGDAGHWRDEAEIVNLGREWAVGAGW